jgi:hypothetical protein
MNCSTNVGQGRHEPVAGDISICGNCGAVAIFNDILTTTPLLPEEIEKYDCRDEIKAAVALIKTRGRFR